MIAVSNFIEISFVPSFPLSLDILSIYRVMIKEIVCNCLANSILYIWKWQDEDQRLLGFTNNWFR